MNFFVFSAGSYGSQLQAATIDRYYDSCSFFIYDDFKKASDFLDKYHVKSVESGSDLSIKCKECIIPSYELSSLESYGIDLSPGISNNKGMLEFILPDSKLLIPSIQNLPNKLVIKPKVSSGSKGIKIIEIDTNHVVQEFIEGPEFIIDVICTSSEILYTTRLSIERENGRDILISLDHDMIDSAETVNILRSIPTLDTYEGPLNIQCRMENGIKLKVMEIDFRLSGSSVLSKAYQTLIDKYIKEVKQPGINKPLVIPKTLTYVKGTYNDEIKSLYENIQLSPPSLWK